MMSLFHKKPTLPPEEREKIVESIERARRSQEDSSEQYRKTLLLGFEINRLVSTIADRRLRNGFGDSMQITFTPRRANAEPR